MTMPLVCLSTMWAQQERFVGNFAEFSRIAKAAGYGGIEVSHSTAAAALDELVRASALPLASLHAPTPLMPAHKASRNSSLNLASTDEEERGEAVAHTLRTIEYAARCGARYVVVHLGGLPRMLSQEQRLRRLYEQGLIEGDEARALQLEAHRVRAEAVGPHMAAARRSLESLVDAAAARGIAIGLENRLHFHEIPSPEETIELLAPYPRAQAGYWHDTGHLEVQGRLGLLDPRVVLASLTPCLIGTHLHDVRGIRDHRAPGSGDVDWGYITAALSPDTARTLEIDQREPEELLGGALRFLAERGVLNNAEA